MRAIYSRRPYRINFVNIGHIRMELFGEVVFYSPRLGCAARYSGRKLAKVFLVGTDWII